MLGPCTNQKENKWIHNHITLNSFRTDLKGLTLYMESFISNATVNPLASSHSFTFTQ